MQKPHFSVDITRTPAVCAIGETIGERNIAERAIPVLSCEGACIRGEIARLAAHELARQPGFRRACHGELFSVPHSAMARWVAEASEIVVIDGCHLHCHARIVEHLAEPERLRTFDAFARHRRYLDRFDIDSVPEQERAAVARDVADWVRGRLEQPLSDESDPGPCSVGGSCPS